MGKHVFVLADLDALADDNKLVNVFRDAAQHAANASGMESIMEMDRAIRDTFASLLDRAFAALSPSTLNHQYWTARGQEAKDELKAKRRATLAVLLSLSIDEIDQNTVATELSPLRKRYDALLDALSTAGCTILRSGTIEDYYFQEYPTNLYGKPEAAAMEMEHVLALPLADIQKQYHDVIRAMHVSAPLKKIDENSLLREQLGSLLGAALQIARPGMLDDELNARAAANLSAGAPVFRFANRSIQDNVSGVTRSIEVSITSPLFARQGFPFEISERDNLTALIDQKLPSK